MSESRSIRGPGLDVGFVRDWFTRYWLAVWFGTISGIGILVGLQGGMVLFFDAHLYLDATRAWLDGGNPWAIARAGFFFAAPPPTLLPLVPFALLPHEVGVVVLAAVIVAASVAAIRMLDLPWWWLLFPPVVHSILSANVQALLVPLLLTRGAWLAVFFKVYAVVPLVILGRWRQVMASGLVIAITVPILPWAAFLADLPGIAARLAEQSRYGLAPLALGLLAPLGVIALIVVGRERAAWLAVPALWPSQQIYYPTLALPTKSRLVTALISVPVAGSGLLALVVLAAVHLRKRRLMVPSSSRSHQADGATDHAGEQPGPMSR